MLNIEEMVVPLGISGTPTNTIFTFTPNISTISATTQFSSDGTTFSNLDAAFTIIAGQQSVITRNIPNTAILLRIATTDSAIIITTSVPPPVIPVPLVASGNPTNTMFTFTPNVSTISTSTQFSSDGTTFSSIGVPFSITAGQQSVITRNIPNTAILLRIATTDSAIIITTPVAAPVIPVPLVISGNSINNILTFTPDTSRSNVRTQYSLDGLTFSSIGVPFSITAGVQSVIELANVPNDTLLLRIATTASATASATIITTAVSPAPPIPLVISGTSTNTIFTFTTNFISPAAVVQFSLDGTTFSDHGTTFLISNGENIIERTGLPTSIKLLRIILYFSRRIVTTAVPPVPTSAPSLVSPTTNTAASAATSRLESTMMRASKAQGTFKPADGAAWIRYLKR
jgi:hypothetical protein